MKTKIRNIIGVNYLKISKIHLVNYSITNIIKITEKVKYKKREKTPLIVLCIH